MQCSLRIFIRLHSSCFLTAFQVLVIVWVLCEVSFNGARITTNKIVHIGREESVNLYQGRYLFVNLAAILVELTRSSHRLVDWNHKKKANNKNGSLFEWWSHITFSWLFTHGRFHCCQRSLSSHQSNLSQILGGKGNIEISFFFKSNDALITIRGCITDSLNAILSVLNDVFKCSIVQQLRVSSRHRHLKNKSTH